MIALHANEKVLDVHRKTWVVFAATVAMAFSLLIAPAIFLPFVPLLPGNFAPQMTQEFLLFAFTMWWWTVWIGSFFAFVNYYLDVFVVTNERIMRIEQHGPFSRTVAELRLERVQDVTIEQHGLLPTFLHYGNLRVQTAGETGEFTFSAIPHPVRAKEVIMAAHRDSILHIHRNGAT